MARPPITVQTTKIEIMGQKLDKMAQVPKKIPLQDFIAALFPKIQAAQKAGYSLEDITEAFQAEEIPISVSTLKSYLRKLNESPQASSSESKPSSEPEPEASSEPEVAVVPSSEVETTEPALEAELVG